MQNLYRDLLKVLQEEKKFLVDSQVSKEKVVQSALTLDEDLLAIVVKHPALKKHFMAQVGDILVFDKVAFQKFLLNKDFLPDNFTQYSNKVGLRNSSGFVVDSSDVELVWPFKDTILEGGQDQDDAKRDEIFWNTTLAPDQIDLLLSPKAFVAFEAISSSEQHVTPDRIQIKDNLLIKGNNLLALYSLLPRYRGKIDLIYIDPPYNPDSKNNTFTYNNSFNRSTWLTFMKNRLDVAKQLLTKSGSLICAIDENEHVHLGVLLKEIFLDHEVHCITIVHNPRGVQGANFSHTHEYAFFVIPKGQKSVVPVVIEDSEVDWNPLRNWGSESERTDAKNCFYPVRVREGEIVGFGDVCADDFHPKQNEKNGDETWVYPIDNSGIERKWRYARQSVEEIQKLLRVKPTKRGFDIEIGKNFGTPKTVWQNSRYDANVYGTQLLKDLVPESEFLFPKSLWNVYDCLRAIVGSNKSAIVLDFFAGSGTTGHAVLELNKADGGDRQFILCEQMDYVQSITKKRLKEVIRRQNNGSFIYMEIAKVNEMYVDAIQQAKNMEKLEAIWGEMQNSSFLSYRLPSALEQIRVHGFSELTVEEVRTFLLTILDLNMLYVPYSEIKDEAFGLSKHEISLNESFYDNE